MAVDTRDKRMSMVGLAQFGFLPYVMPNPAGSNFDTVFERAQMLHLYAGINIQSGQPTMLRWGGIPHVRLTRNPFGRSW